MQNVIKTPATGVLPQHSISDLSQTFSSVISDYESNVTIIPSSQHSDNTTRNIKIPQAMVNKSLDNIGNTYYSDLEEFLPSLH